MLKSKKIIVGITGSIAAYKSALLVRLLKNAGADVRVIMTKDAENFITPLSLQVLSGNPVHSALISESESWNNHVELGLWADLMLIAPCTANTLAKMAAGICDNLLLAAYLSARCPVCIAPAMDEDMWHHGTTQTNIALLKNRKVNFLPVGFGALASGLVGNGRMAEPEEIVACIVNTYFNTPKLLAGKHVLINAGPTREPIDPVRFISNYSSGKMGIALAEAARLAGAEVSLVLGPVSIPMPQGITIINVITAEEMYTACLNHFAACDIAILAAAVADYTPATVSTHKIKKQGDTLEITLLQTKDILHTLGAQKTRQYLVGFALETHNGIENATEKLHRKHCDMIVLNTLEDADAGFAHDTNKVTLLTKDGKRVDLSLKSKNQIAQEIIAHVAQNI